MQKLITQGNKEILFIIPPSRFSTHRYNLAYLYLSSYLLSKGFDNSIIEPHKLLDKKYKYHDINKANLKIILSNFAKLIKRSSPKVVCFNAFTHEFMEIANLIKIVKENSSAKIIVGGYHSTAMPSEFLDYGADFSVFGEGEITQYELVKAIYNNESDFSKINGLGWIKNSKKIINSLRVPTANLDDFPSPAYNKIDMERYLSIWDGTVRGFPLRACDMYTTRGCPYNCSFCGCNAVFGRKLRYRSEQRIEEEVKLLKNKYGVEAIMFVDDTLTVNKNHLKVICRIMKKHKMIWDCQARVNTIDSEMLELMTKSGCVQLCFGVESGSQRVLDNIINKGIKVGDTKRAFQLCKEHGIHPMANFMIGLPTETKAEMEQTFNLAKEINASYYFYSVVCPLPGTKLYTMAGINIPPEQYYKLNWENPQIEEFNRSEVKDVFELRNKYYQELNKTMFRNAFLDFPNYFSIWWKLPRKMRRINYVVRKLYNYFIFKRFTGKSLRL
jgi:anaerobic magnesium-protoporphyrin IX monomethyl ester cyclase